MNHQLTSLKHRCIKENFIRKIKNTINIFENIFARVSKIENAKRQIFFAVHKMLLRLEELRRHSTVEDFHGQPSSKEGRAETVY